MTPLTDEQKKLVEDHMTLADNIARVRAKRAGSRAILGELKSSACLGMMQAATTFDPSRGFKFATYAQRRSAGQIDDDLRNNRWFSMGEGKKPGVRNDRSRPPQPHLASHRTHVLSNRSVTMGSQRDSVNRDALAAMLKDLPHQYALMLKLYYVAGMTMKETGAAMGYTESHVSNEMPKALAAARKTKAAQELMEAV